jgi:hypothetical protein
VVSGSYAPGDIYLFKGLGKGAFAECQLLLQPNGEPARAGLASSVAIADWDRDGHLDLVVGNINGDVSFLRNASKKARTAFDAPRSLLDDGRLQRVSGDAGPLVVDWDGDGVSDLLVGSNDGSVTFFKGAGPSGAPELALGVPLIAPLRESDMTLHAPVDPKTGELTLPPLDRSMLRSKVAVYDWNGDGKLDILVGDFVSALGPEPELDAEEQHSRDEVEKQWRKLNAEIQSLSHAATLRASAELGIRDEWSYPASRRMVAARRDQILEADPRYVEIRTEATALWNKLDKFKAKHATHGFVWVYLRK